MRTSTYLAGVVLAGAFALPGPALTNAAALSAVLVERGFTLNTSFSLKERYYFHLNRPGSMHGTNISHSQRGTYQRKLLELTPLFEASS